jgi:MFS transporter, DHA2 family, multidrug resistance protein
MVYRALQGFLGGGMIPTVFATAFTLFPREKQSVVSPVIGLVATLAPTIGPTAGGYLTDLFSWHWLFLINIVPGILTAVSVWLLMDIDKPNLKLLDNFDWFGLFSMAAFLGALEYVLEEGPSKDWLNDQRVAICAVVSLIGGVVFFWRTFTARQPIVDLSAFRDRNFWTGSMFSFVLGIGLYGLTYLYPVFLARVRGFSALQIGETMFLTGICMFFTAPIAGRMMNRLDPRVMIATGFVGFAIGTWWASYVTKDWQYGELIIPQILRGCSLMFCMIPITQTALGTLKPEKLKNASGLFNLTRNLGGAFGLALINTLLNKRMDLHLERLHERIAWGRDQAEQVLANLTGAMATMGSDAQVTALKRLALLVRREATVMAISDVFLALTILFLACSLLATMMRAPAPSAPGTGGGH